MIGKASKTKTKTNIFLGARPDEIEEGGVGQEKQYLGEVIHLLFY